MKSSKLRRVILFVLALITVGILLASCNDIFKPQGAAEPPQIQTQSVLSREMELSL